MREPAEFHGSMNLLTGEYYPVGDEAQPTPEEWKLLWDRITYDPDPCKHCGGSVNDLCEPHYCLRCGRKA